MSSKIPEIAATLVQSALCRTRGITAVARPIPTLFYYPGKRFWLFSSFFHTIVYVHYTSMYEI